MTGPEGVAGVVVSVAGWLSVAALAGVVARRAWQGRRRPAGRRRVGHVMLRVPAGQLMPRDQVVASMLRVTPPEGGHGWVRVEVAPGVVQETHQCTPAVVLTPDGDTVHVCRRQYGDGKECGAVWAVRPLAAYRQRVYRTDGER